MNELRPYGDNVLVLLGEQYEHIALPEKKHETKTSGTVVAVSQDKDMILLGKEIFFEAYKDDSRVESNGDTYAFINIKDIRGYKDGES